MHPPPRAPRLPCFNAPCAILSEVWNFGFPQYRINKAMAQWEVQNVTTSKSNLANAVPGRPDINCTFNAECWAHRRHARRVYEIAQTFEKVFGHGSINTRVRPVYASWTINLQVCAMRLADLAVGLPIESDAERLVSE